MKQVAAIRRAGSIAKQNGASLTILSVIKALPDELANNFRQAGIDAQVKSVAGTAFMEVIREVLGGAA